MMLPTRQYGDPLDVLIRAEERSCKGCHYREPDNNGTKAYCINPNTRELLAEVRCESYEGTE